MILFPQLAVEQGFGGSDSKEKAEWMVVAIDTWFKENCKLLIFCSVKPKVVFELSELELQ